MCPRPCLWGSNKDEVGKLSTGAAAIDGERGRRAVLWRIPLLLESDSLELRWASREETAARGSSKLSGWANVDFRG